MQLATSIDHSEWTYVGIPCRLERDGQTFVGSIRLEDPDHPWFSRQARHCTVGGERVDCKGSRRCFWREDDWIFELRIRSGRPDALDRAKFELNLLADAAAFVAKRGAK